jgi:hypothetical protein
MPTLGRRLHADVRGHAQRFSALEIQMMVKATAASVIRAAPCSSRCNPPFGCFVSGLPMDRLMRADQAGQIAARRKLREKKAVATARHAVLQRP